MFTSDYIASHRTVPVSSDRFESSPFLDKHVTPDTAFSVYAGRLAAFTFDDDPTDDYWRLRQQAGLFDVPERPIEIVGPESLKLLETIFSRTISTLKVNRARYAVACLPDGGILMDGVLMRLADDRFWYVVANGEFTFWLRAHAHGLDVQINDPQSWVLQVQGPTSLEVLDSVTGGVLGEGFGYFHTAMVDMGGQDILVSRTGWTGEMGFEIYTQGDKTDCPALWDHLIAQGEPHGLAYCSLKAMGIRRVEAGILNNGSDMDGTMTPYAAGLGRFIDLDKPDFIGREALQAADQTCRLFGLICRDAESYFGLGAVSLPIGADVVDGNQRVARVTAAHWSPSLEAGVGYVRFDAPGNWVGRTLMLNVHDGSRHPCEIVELPFYDPEKKIARGIDRSIPERPD